MKEKTKTPPTAETVESIHATTAIIIAHNAGKVNTFVCNIDKVAYTNKADAKRELGSIVKRMKQENHIEEMTADRLSKTVTTGYSFTAAALNGTTEKHFISQQLAVVDIDNERKDFPEMTVDEAKSTLAAHGIDYAFMYYSFSHTTERAKFRIVCILSEPITDPHEAKRLNQYFISLFPQADKSCFDLSRLYFGTNKGLASPMYDRAASITVPDGWQVEEAPKIEATATPIRESKPKPPPLQSTFNLTAAINEFDLLEYVEATTGAKGKKHGKDFLINPCPICGHKDDFYVDTEKNVFKCFGAGGNVGGNIITYIEETRRLSREEARKFFMYDILRRDENADRAAFKAALKENKKYTARKRKIDTSAEERGLSFSDCPIGVNSAIYRGTDNGIFLGDKYIIRQPLVITQELINAETQFIMIELAFKYNGKWKRYTTTAETISNKNKIVSLADAGIKVTTKNAAEVVQYLSVLRDENADVIPIVESISRVGYIGEDFVPYTGGYVYSGDTSYKNAYDSIKVAGSYDEWLKIIRDVRNNSPAARAALNLSFASPLVKLLNISPFYVHLWGESGTGKTISLWLAASVWGEPKNYTHTCNATQVALERAAYFHQNTPLILDEIQTVRSKYKGENASFGEMIYNLTEGKGRMRGTLRGLDTTLTWANAFLTSGEQPLTTTHSSTGEFNRGVEITVQNIFDNPAHIYDTIMENYGHAGRHFITELPNYDVKAIGKALETTIRESVPTLTGKQLLVSKALVTADVLVNSILFGAPIEEAKQEASAFANDLVQHFPAATEMDVIKKAYEYVIGWVAEHRDKFHDETTPQDEAAKADLKEQWGKYSKKNKSYFISGNALQNALETGRFNYRAVLKGFASRGYIITHASDANTSLTKIINLGGTRVRGVELREAIHD